MPIISEADGGAPPPNVAGPSSAPGPEFQSGLPKAATAPEPLGPVPSVSSTAASSVAQSAPVSAVTSQQLAALAKRLSSGPAGAIVGQQPVLPERDQAQTANSNPLSDAERAELEALRKKADLYHAFDAGSTESTKTRAKS